VVERELRALDIHPTNLHQLQDAILSVNGPTFLKNAFSTSATILCGTDSAPAINAT